MPGGEASRLPSRSGSGSSSTLPLGTPRAWPALDCLSKLAPASHPPPFLRPPTATKGTPLSFFLSHPTQLPGSFLLEHTNATQGLDSGQPGRTLEDRATSQGYLTALRAPVLALPCTPWVCVDELPQGPNIHACTQLLEPFKDMGPKRHVPRGPYTAR